MLLAEAPMGIADQAAMLPAVTLGLWYSGRCSPRTRGAVRARRPRRPWPTPAQTGAPRVRGRGPGAAAARARRHRRSGRGRRRRPFRPTGSPPAPWCSRSTLELAALNGHESHSGTTEVGLGAAPFSTLELGHGNDGSRDAARQGHVIGTDLDGPRRPGNADLAGLLLGWATAARLDPRPPPPPMPCGAAHRRGPRRPERLGWPPGSTAR